MDDLLRTIVAFIVLAIGFVVAFKVGKI